MHWRIDIETSRNCYPACDCHGYYDTLFPALALQSFLTLSVPVVPLIPSLYRLTLPPPLATLSTSSFCLISVRVADVGLHIDQKQVETGILLMVPRDARGNDFPGLFLWSHLGRARPLYSLSGASRLVLGVSLVSGSRPIAPAPLLLISNTELHFPTFRTVGHIVLHPTPSLRLSVELVPIAVSVSARYCSVSYGGRVYRTLVPTSGHIDRATYRPTNP